MPSPVSSGQFCDAVPNPNADLCTRLTRFFNVVNLLCDFFGWFLGSDSTISTEAKEDIATFVAPTGMIVFSAGTNMGTAWLLCDGSAVSRTTYANLYSVIGTRYGLGDGSTTFTLPDFRGRSPIGAGTGTQGGTLTNRDIASKFVGEESHTQTVAEMPSHTHAFDTTDSAQVLTKVAANRHGSINQTGSLDYNFANALASTGGGSPFNVVHPCFVAYPFIKT